MSFDVRVYRIAIESTGYGAHDVTGYVASVVSESGVHKGISVVYTAEEGCSVVEIEYEPELLADLERLLKDIGCAERSLCSAVLGRSVAVPIINGSLFLGRFKNVVLVDMSGRAGEKSLVVVVEGLRKGG